MDRIHMVPIFSLSRFVCDGKENLSKVIHDLKKYLGREDIRLAPANLREEH